MPSPALSDTLFRPGLLRRRLAGVRLPRGDGLSPVRRIRNGPLRPASARLASAILPRATHRIPSLSWLLGPRRRASPVEDHCGAAPIDQSWNEQSRGRKRREALWACNPHSPVLRFADATRSAPFGQACRSIGAARSSSARRAAPVPLGSPAYPVMARGRARSPRAQLTRIWRRGRSSDCSGIDPRRRAATKRSTRPSSAAGRR